jgi:hypothetical protein
VAEKVVPRAGDLLGILEGIVLDLGVVTVVGGRCEVAVGWMLVVEMLRVTEWWCVYLQ